MKINKRKTIKLNIIILIIMYFFNFLIYYPSLIVKAEGTVGTLPFFPGNAIKDVRPAEVLFYLITNALKGIDKYEIFTIDEAELQADLYQDYINRYPQFAETITTFERDDYNGVPVVGFEVTPEQVSYVRQYLENKIIDPVIYRKIEEPLYCESGVTRNIVIDIDTDEAVELTFKDAIVTSWRVPYFDLKGVYYSKAYPNTVVGGKTIGTGYFMDDYQTNPNAINQKYKVWYENINGITVAKCQEINQDGTIRNTVSTDLYGDILTPQITLRGVNLGGSVTAVIGLATQIPVRTVQQPVISGIPLDDPKSVKVLIPKDMPVENVVAQDVTLPGTDINVEIPTDDTTTETGLLQGIKDLLTDIPNTITQGYESVVSAVQSIPNAIAKALDEAVPAGATEIDPGDYGLPDLFNILMLILIALIRLFLQALAMIVELGKIAASTTLLNAYTVQALDFLKNTKLAGFNLSFYSIVTSIIFSIQVFAIIKVLRKYIHKEYS